MLVTLFLALACGAPHGDGPDSRRRPVDVSLQRHFRRCEFDVLRLAAPLEGGEPSPLAPQLERQFKAAQPVLLVRGGRWSGSAVVWDAAAHLVLTALHVVEEMPPKDIRVTISGRQLEARIVDRDPWLDLALLEVAGEVEAGPPLGASATLKPGESVEIAGCPAARCGQRPAVVLDAFRHFAGSRYVAIGAEVRPGASGGPVLDAGGALIGIMDLALSGEGAVGLAIPIERAAARFPQRAERLAKLVH